MGQMSSTNIKALALNVLAAGKSVSAHGTMSASQGTAKDSFKNDQPLAMAACGSRNCAGCYEVEPGVRFHPPKSSEEWKEWLLKWEPKGKVQ